MQNDTNSLKSVSAKTLTGLHSMFKSASKLMQKSNCSKNPCQGQVENTENVPDPNPFRQKSEKFFTSSNNA